MTDEAEPGDGTEPEPSGPDEQGDDTSGAAGETPRRFGPPRKELWTFVEFFAVSGLLVAQPLFDFLGRNQRALTVLRLSLSDVVAFTLLVLIVPPTAMWAFEVLIGLVLPKWRARVHIGMISVLLGLAAAAILKVGTKVGPAVWIIVLVAATALAAWALLRRSGVWQWLHLLAIAPLIFALLFVAASPTSVLYLQHPKVADVTVENPAHVVMIVFDEFPERSLMQEGHIDRELFPNFARLADDSTWYRNETTVGLYTGRAVPAILTGRIPPEKAVTAVAQNYPHSLFTLLGGTYEMHASEKFEQLCPTSLCTEPNHGSAFKDLVRASRKVMSNLLDVDRNSWDRNDGFRWGADIETLLGEPSISKIADDFVASLQASDKPRLDYLHLLFPHAPWRYFGDWRIRTHDSSLVKVQNSGDANVRELGRQLHLLQVQAADYFVGQVIDRLKAIDQYDNSLVVVTADHGVAFPYWRAVTKTNYPNLLWTPLFIKAPNQAEGKIDDRPMLSADVLPTMADTLGVKIPWKIDGISALQSPRAEGERPIMTRPSEEVGLERSFDGRTGFRRLMRSTVAPPGGDPALRLYRVGPFGALVGRSVEPLAKPPPDWLHGDLRSPDRFENVDPDAQAVPWAIAHGVVKGVGPSHTIALAVNGRVAGLALLDREHEYYAPLAPALFEAGENTITPYLVQGTLKKPVLVPITETRTVSKG